MKQRNELLLQVPAHVNHEVAATDEIKPGERRVLDHILLGEDQHVADVFVMSWAGISAGGTCLAFSLSFFLDFMI